MEWRDIAPIALAVIIVLALSFGVKPLLSEGDTDIGSMIPFFAGEETPAPTATPIEVLSRPPTPAPTRIPTPTPVWDGSVHKVGFVNPATYHHDIEGQGRISANIPFSPPPSTSTMVTYATIKGKWSGTTEIITIPFPCWELHYTVEPMTEPGSVFPGINIQVMDANDPNRFVRIINPGILDSRLWKDTDPRPWKEKFYEGQRNYYFIITTRFVQSYTVTIKVPQNTNT
ncbi:MAG: hypothetical protein QCH35_00805 [Methanomicrobiaceae archaeon]|nr:hypothetical protein [Methanomicrobiaceae archaeon]